VPRFGEKIQPFARNLALVNPLFRKAVLQSIGIDRLFRKS
jgi:hypothetical protein